LCVGGFARGRIVVKFSRHTHLAAAKYNEKAKAALQAWSRQQTVNQERAIKVLRHADDIVACVWSHSLIRKTAAFLFYYFQHHQANAPRESRLCVCMINQTHCRRMTKYLLNSHHVGSFFTPKSTPEVIDFFAQRNYLQNKSAEMLIEGLSAFHLRILIFSNKRALFAVLTFQ